MTPVAFGLVMDHAKARRHYTNPQSSRPRRAMAEKIESLKRSRATLRREHYRQLDMHLQGLRVCRFVSEAGPCRA